MVTKAYLRAWADSQGMVDVVDLEDRRIRSASVKRATTVDYAYDPSLLNYDLEGDYERVESQGLPVIVKLRHRHPISEIEKTRMVAFLDMHLDRGRYANQTTLRNPAVALRTGGQIEHVELNLGDRMLLSQSLPDVLRLRSLELDQWRWEVRAAQNLVTGDGAVLLWKTADDSDNIAGVSFPLSSTDLLVIGQDIFGQPNLRKLVIDNSRRWVVGTRGTFVSDQVPTRAIRRPNKSPS